MEKHTKIIWTVITPSFPEQNAAFNINYSTATIIRKELIEKEEGIFEEFTKNIEMSYFRILAKENKLSEEEIEQFMLKIKYLTLEELKSNLLN
uniref:PAP_central domain-containing protein n=1 Tax=Meloidogyne hapla TaxID=6305 RepID=A0A1I8BJ38_MELHA